MSDINSQVWTDTGGDMTVTVLYIHNVSTVSVSPLLSY